MEKIVQINWENQKIDITVGEITWEEKMKAVRNSIKEVQKGRVLRKEVDNILQKELMLVASIKKCPFEFTRNTLNKISSRDGERLYQAYSELNELNEDEEELDEKA